jgi:multiple antibiotic resistance protein
VLAVLHVSEPSLHIAGGIVLFLIAVRMIFSAVALDFAGEKGEEPLVVPLAVPAVAGPSAMATVLILVSQYPGRLAEWAAALLLAWVVVAATLLASSLLSRLLGRRGLLALQRLMGMVLTTLAVEMFLTGVRQFLGK